MVDGGGSSFEAVSRGSGDTRLPGGGGNPALSISLSLPGGGSVLGCNNPTSSSTVLCVGGGGVGLSLCSDRGLTGGVAGGAHISGGLGLSLS